MENSIGVFMHLLIPYDIRDDKRRRIVDKVLSHFGRRVNYSVFEVELNKSKFRKLIAALEKHSDAKEDHIRIYVLNKDTVKKSFVLHEKGGIFDHEELYI